MLASPPSLGLFSDPVMDPDTVQVETPSGNRLMIQCNSTEFGAGLNAQSCSNALAKSPTGERQETWAVHSRGGPNPPVDVVLPVVEVSDDANCLLVPTLLDLRAIGHASAMNVSDAARAILQECVIRRRIGGSVVGIGGDNRVAVIMAQSHAQAQCVGTVTTPPSSCRYIMDEMDKTVTNERFGRTGRVDVALPLTLRAPDGKCQVTIDVATPQSTVTIKWHRIWLAVEALVTLCVNNGKGGRAIPEGRGLSVSIVDEPDPSRVIAVSAEDTSG